MRGKAAQILRRRLEKKLDRFLNILQRLFASPPLRPAALERRTVRGKETIFSALDDNVQGHDQS
jgi:hypothetical protein